MFLRRKRCLAKSEDNSLTIFLTSCWVILHTSIREVHLVAIYGVYEILLRLLQTLSLHYCLLLLFVSPLITQLPIIYCILFTGILHTHINQTMLNFITEFMEHTLSHSSSFLSLQLLAYSKNRSSWHHYALHPKECLSSNLIKCPE